MRDRLIELIQSSVGGCARHWAEVIADHILAAGCILPPCKVGETVYKVVGDKRVKKPYECNVVGVWVSADDERNDAHLVRYVSGVFDCSFSVPWTEFGKTVFLTKEQAERALAERREG